MPDRPAILVFAYHNVGYECLDVLIRRKENIVGVFTHKDDPKEEIWFKSVVDLAGRHGIPVHTPESVNTPLWIEKIRGMRPEIIFSYYYRNMIRQEILDLPRLGAFNMHGSLLPKYRGRVPINWAVLHGERETGATLHYMVKSADAEAPDTARTDGEVAFVIFGKIATLLLVHHRMHGFAGLFRRQRGFGHGHDLAVDLHRRRHTRGDEQVRAALFDHQAQQFFEFHGLSRHRHHAPCIECRWGACFASGQLTGAPCGGRQRLEVFRSLGFFPRGLAADQPLGHQPFEAGVEGLHAY